MNRERTPQSIIGRPFIEWLALLEDNIDRQQSGLEALSCFYEAAELRKTTRVLADVASMSIDEELMRVANDVKARALQCQISAAKLVLSLRNRDKEMHESLMRTNRYIAIVTFLEKHECLAAE